MRKLLLLLAASLFVLFGCSKSSNSDENLDSFTLWIEKGMAEVWAGATGDILAMQEWQKATGKTVEFVNPTGDVTEEFNLMMSSGEDLPDMVYWGWYPATSSAYAENEVIWDISPYITPEIMPNFYAVLEENPTARKQITSEDGSIYYIPWITPEKYFYEGAMIRGDWLAATGLPMPETPDELTEVCLAMQDLHEKGELPNSGENFYCLSGYVNQILKLTYAFGAAKDYIIDEETGEIIYSPTTDEYREAMIWFYDMWNLGLVDPDILSNDLDTYMSHHTTSQTALYIDNVGSFSAVEASLGLGEVYVPMPYLTTEKGSTPMEYNSTAKRVAQPYGIAFTNSLTEAELIEALKMIDWAYGEEGQLLFNWGVEGVTYEVAEDGTKTYTDTIMEPADGGDKYTEWSKYCYDGMTVSDVEAQEALLSERDKEAWEAWGNTDPTYAMEPFLWYTPEEQDIINQYESDMKTYVDTWTTSFMIGEKDPTDDATWEEYLTGLQELGVEQILEAQNAAYDRYMAE